MIVLQVLLVNSLYWRSVSFAFCT